MVITVVVVVIVVVVVVGVVAIPVLRYVACLILSRQAPPRVPGGDSSRWVWVAESEARGPSRGHAEQGRWFRLHAQGKPAATFDTGIVNVAVAVLDSDVRRAMYGQPLLSQEKFKGMLASPGLGTLLPPSPPFPPCLPTCQLMVRVCTPQVHGQ